MRIGSRSIPQGVFALLAGLDSPASSGALPADAAPAQDVPGVVFPAGPSAVRILNC
jgi:hypothetical protein